jgi:hypothetical protein
MVDVIATGKHAFQDVAKVQARRDALRVVDAVPPGAERTQRRKKKDTTGGLRVIDGDGAAQS